MIKKKNIFIAVSALILVILLISFYDQVPFVENFIQEYKIDRIKRKLGKDPYSVKLHYELSQLFLKRGELEKYEEQLRVLRELSPESYSFAEKMGDHYFRSNQYEEAIRSYKEALTLYEGEDNLLHFRIANAYVNLNDTENALKEYKIQLQLLESNPDKKKTEKMRKSIIDIISRVERQQRDQGKKDT